LSKEKITKEQFLGALKQACGIFGDTPAIIKELYDVKISRQAVRNRALNYPDDLQAIRDASVIDAEDTVRDLMKNAKAEPVRRGCAEYLLDRLGKDKGYTPKSEVDSVNLNIEGEVDVAFYIPENGRDPDLKREEPEGESKDEATDPSDGAGKD
jgi:hypothetical protein